MRKYINTFEELTNENKLFAFHVTRRKNLVNINKIGIEPRIPIDYGENGDTKGGVLI